MRVAVHLQRWRRLDALCRNSSRISRIINSDGTPLAPARRLRRGLQRVERRAHSVQVMKEKEKEEEEEQQEEEGGAPPPPVEPGLSRGFLVLRPKQVRRRQQDRGTAKAAGERRRGAARQVRAPPCLVVPLRSLPSLARPQQSVEARRKVAVAAAVVRASCRAPAAPVVSNLRLASGACSHRRPSTSCSAGSRKTWSTRIRRDRTSRGCPPRRVSPLSRWTTGSVTPGNACARTSSAPECMVARTAAAAAPPVRPPQLVLRQAAGEGVPAEVPEVVVAPAAARGAGARGRRRRAGVRPVRRGAQSATSSGWTC